MAVGLLFLGLSFFILPAYANGLVDDCLRWNANIRVSQGINYSCVNSQTDNECLCRFNSTDEATFVLATIPKIPSDASGHIKIYDGESVQHENFIPLDSDGVEYYETAVVSRVPIMTILFKKQLNVLLNISVEAFHCGGSYYKPQGHIIMPTVSQNSEKRVPKNLFCEFTIHPFMESTTIVEFVDVDLGSTKSSKEEIKIVTNNGKASTSTDIEKDSQIVETADNVSIRFDSKRTILDRSTGFSIEFEVCTMESSSQSGLLKFPFLPFLGHKTSRCSYNLSLEGQNVPIITISNVNDTDEDTEVYLVIPEANNASSLATRLPKGESYIISSSKAVLVLEYLSNGSLTGQIIAGNFSSIGQECRQTFHDINGTFTSIRYAGKYPNNVDCAYVVNITKGGHLLMLFTDLSLADPHDYVQISVDENINFTIPVNQSSYLFASESNEVTIVLHSNEEGTAEGFSLDWTVCGGYYPTPNGSKTYISSFTNYNSSTNCTYILGNQGVANTILFYQSESLEANCITVDQGDLGTESLCHNQAITTNSSSSSTRIRFANNQDNFTVFWIQSPWTVESKTGTLMSFGYPYWYPTNTRIEYVIKNRDDEDTLSISIIELNIGEDASNCTTEYAEFSFTNITSGVFQRQRLCGTVLSFDLQSQADVKISFITGTKLFKGFRLNYKISSLDDTSRNSIPKSGTDDMTIIIAIASSLCAATAVLIVVALVVLHIRRKKNEENYSGTREQKGDEYENRAVNEIRPISISYGNENYVYRKNVHDSMDPVYEEKPDGIYDKLREKREHIKGPEEESANGQPTESSRDDQKTQGQNQEGTIELAEDANALRKNSHNYTMVTKQFKSEKEGKDREETEIVDKPSE